MSSVREGKHRELFFKVCRKYALKREDCRRLLRAISERGLIDAAMKAAAVREFNLAAPGQEMACLEALCQRIDIDESLMHDSSDDLGMRTCD